MIARERIGQERRRNPHGRFPFEQIPPRPTPNQMGLGVTIGIAAAPLAPYNGTPFIVTVSDMREGFGIEVPGIDTGRFKTSRISRDWGFLYAGGDARYSSPIARKAMELLGGNLWNSYYEMERVKAAVCLAYQRVREDFVVNKYLSPLHYNSIDEFKKRGRRDFGQGINALLKKISDYDLGMELLVYGFDSLGHHAWLIDIQNPGVAIEHDSPEHWAVGSGFHIAMASLNQRRPQDPERTEATYIYRLCEAKFLAEFADGVGDATTVAVWYPRGLYSFIDEKQIKAIRQMCARAKYAPIPKRAKKMLTEIIDGQAERRAAMFSLGDP